MLTYMRRFHTSGRRKRIRAKLKYFVETGSLNYHNYAQKEASPDPQTKAGSSLGAFPEKLAAEVHNEIDYDTVDALSEKQILHANLKAQICCPLQSPPAYNECVGPGPSSVDILKEKTLGLLTLTQNFEPISSSKDLNINSERDKCAHIVVEHKEHMNLEDNAEATMQKPAERGRKTTILYRSQLKTFTEHRSVRRPSPRINRRVKALPHDLVCCSMVLQSNIMVETWCKSFTALQVFVVATLLFIFATNCSS